MANNNEQKTYCNALQIKEVTFPTSGKKILKIGINAERMIEFIRQHAKPNGYLNIGISSRNSVGQYGETHCGWLDTWQPDPNRQQAPAQPRTAAKTESAPTNNGINDDSSDVPF